MIPRIDREIVDKRFLNEIEKFTRKLLDDFEQGQLEEKLNVPIGSLTTTINLMRKLYPAFAEDPEQSLRYSIGTITFFPENKRIFQREVVDADPNNNPSLSSILGIPLLENENQRMAYESIDNFPKKKTIIDYSKIISK